MSGNFVLDELRNLEDCWNAPLLPRAVLPLRCMTRWAGIETGRYPAYRWHGLKRGESEFCLFQYTLEGAGALRVGRASEEIVREGQALLINIPADHEYRALEEVSWRFFFLILHGRETLRITHALEKQHGAVLSFPPDHPALGLAARITRRIIADDYGSSAENSRETYAFLMALLDQLGPSAHPNLQRVDPQLSAAMEYCEHHLHEPMGVAEMARAAGMSRSHFSANSTRTPVTLRWNIYGVSGSLKPGVCCKPLRCLPKKSRRAAAFPAPLISGKSFGKNWASPRRKCEGSQATPASSKTVPPDSTPALPVVRWFRTGYTF